jgi:hypothetical protein
MPPNLIHKKTKQMHVNMPSLEDFWPISQTPYDLEI